LLRPFTPREWDVVDLVCCGCSNEEVARLLGFSKRHGERLIQAAATKVPGHHRLSNRERILFWRAKQIGAAEYRAGLRDEEGFPIVERDYAVTHPDSNHHEILFPESD